MPAIRIFPERPRKDFLAFLYFSPPLLYKKMPETSEMKKVSGISGINT